MLIIKIGGGEHINIEGIISDLANLEEEFIIVHGANWFRDKLANDLNSPKQVITSLSGYSSVYSDQNAIDLLMMAYAGLRNKRIVELCQHYGINAIGLSGIDGKLVQGRRNKGIRVKENNKVKIKRDFSGKPTIVNIQLINLLLSNNYIPVITVPILDENNVAINSENDDIINKIQEHLQANKIIQLIEAPGYLSDKNDENSVISKISQGQLEELEKQADGRIKRKLYALKRLFEYNIDSVIISDGRTDHPIKDALKGKGTVVS